MRTCSVEARVVDSRDEESPVSNLLTRQMSHLVPLLETERLPSPTHIFCYGETPDRISLNGKEVRWFKLVNSVNRTASVGL